MRKRISLYIDGNKADLGDQALVLMDYAVTDIEKPTAVRNTCSKQITLPGTAANDMIFNHAGRPDRDVTPGTFNPLQRTPYTIYSETDELIGSGYVKLDRVNRSGTHREYVITLYGGLGSLLYGLMYDASGEALSLASLTYDVADASFYFSMNKASVAAAWKRLYDGTGSAMWDIVNFAPCYNGVPGKDFAADKARLQGNYENIVTLSRKYVEWETRDLRARLQRPAVRVKKIFDAIVAKAATLGKTLTLDAAFFNSSNPYYEDAWMLLPSLTTYEDSGAGQIGEPSLVDAETLDEVLAEIPMGGYAHLTGQTFSTDASGAMDFSGFDPSFYLKGGITVRLADLNDWYEYNYYLSYYDTTDSKWHGTLVGLQVTVVDRANNIDLAKSDICVFGRAGVADTRLNDLLSYFGPQAYFWGSNGPGMAYFSFDNLQVAASADVRIYIEFIAVSDIEGAGDDEFSLYEQETSAGRPTYATSKMRMKSVSGRFALQSPGSIGTGTTVTKAMLLSNTCSPADFLLSYCRQFGLFVVERDPGNVSVLTRQNFYHPILPQLDLTKRVDVGDVRVSPLSFSKKWQDFRLDTPVTDPEDYYERTYGRKFGDIALDTGQEFNADHEDLLAGSAFKGGVSGLWASPRMYEYDNNGLYVCPALVSGYDDNGTRVVPSFNGVTPLNSSFNGYDFARKVFAFKTEGDECKPVEVAGTLVFFNGIHLNPGNWFLTDDYPALGDDKTICWQIGASADTYTAKVVHLPQFSRYVDDGAGNVTHSFDFGTPAEIFDPSLALTSAASIYTQYWQSYLTDRFNASNKVMAAKVDLRGLAAGIRLLEYIFWYEGALWVLSKITNHSLTTYDLTECEFVQVQNKTNYQQ